MSKARRRLEKMELKSLNRFLNRQSHKSIPQFPPLLLDSLHSSNLKIKQQATLRTPQAVKHRRFPPPGFLLLEHLTDFPSAIADLPQPSPIFPHCNCRFSLLASLIQLKLIQEVASYVRNWHNCNW
ncbi:hypothetical protein LXL04_033694 [Taraxacum kok-saghyz]